MAVHIIESKHNGRVKELRRALVHPPRIDGGLVGIEGRNLVEEAIRSRLKFHAIFVAQGSETLLDSLPIPHEAEIMVLPRALLDAAQTTDSPQPIAALVEPLGWNWQDILGGLDSRTPLVVVLSGVQDPGNLGTILRSVEAFGGTGIVSLPGTVSPWNPKTVRASAGSGFRVPIVAATEDDCMARLSAAEVQTLAAMAHQAEPIHRVSMKGPSAIFIGSEGSGLAPELAARCDARVTIPTTGLAESLNAAIAASILLFESSRQRADAEKQDRERPQ